MKHMFDTCSPDKAGPLGWGCFLLLMLPVLIPVVLFSGIVIYTCITELFKVFFGA